MKNKAHRSFLALAALALCTLLISLRTVEAQTYTAALSPCLEVPTNRLGVLNGAFGTANSGLTGTTLAVNTGFMPIPIYDRRRSMWTTALREPMGAGSSSLRWTPG
jgi:hypothetical protein